MSKNLLRCLTIVATGVVAINIILSGCKGNSKVQERLNEEAESLVYAAYLDKGFMLVGEKTKDKTEISNIFGIIECIIMFQLQIYELFLKRQRKRKKNTQKIAIPTCEIAVAMHETAVAG